MLESIESWKEWRRGWKLEKKISTEICCRTNWILSFALICSNHSIYFGAHCICSWAFCQSWIRFTINPCNIKSNTSNFDVCGLRFVRSHLFVNIKFWPTIEALYVCVREQFTRASYRCSQIPSAQRIYIENEHVRDYDFHHAEIHLIHSTWIGKPQHFSCFHTSLWNVMTNGISTAAIPHICRVDHVITVRLCHQFR